MTSSTNRINNNNDNIIMTISYIKCHFAIYKALAFNDLIWILQQLCEVDGSCYQPILQLRKMRVAAEENEGRRREGLSLVSALLPELGTRTEMQVIWFSVQFSVPWTIRSLCPEMVFPNLKKKKLFWLKYKSTSLFRSLLYCPNFWVKTSKNMKGNKRKKFISLNTYNLSKI